ncbi:glycerophosphodiester phosphodiesterase family protein [Salinibacterium xinjiangense]|uniref:glycerophosphodiester phosphodiesterase family protein n=1 Tax=Salinibacterium xinjiangense TaxID=386302 RepID=UPI0035710219
MAPQRSLLVIAHRGASGYRPEHSRGAFELAFELGADAIEPDLVPTKDGVLVVRHENEISGTTDVAKHPEFAQRRTTKTVDGVTQNGWFTEDFTWAELRSLRAVERLPGIRSESATFDGVFPILRLIDLFGIIDAQDRPGVMVAEIKHATYFASIGLPMDELFAAEITGWATEDNLVVESFEQTVLGQIRGRGVPGRSVFLAEASGAPADLVARDGNDARSYADHLEVAGLGWLAEEVDGVSVEKKLLLADTGRAFVDRAHDSGLDVFTWTLRAENRFLGGGFRRGTDPAAWGDWRGEFRRILDVGVDGVFADQPDLVREVLAD